MYTLICGSPKIGKSNSRNFLNTVCSKIDDYKLFELKDDNYDEILDSINNSSILVFAFPLYVDSPTSITLKFMDYVIDNKIKLSGKMVYFIVNCGFLEGKQNITAINVVKRWCNKVDAIYGSSLLIGAGEIIGNKQYSFISNNARKKLNEFANTISLKLIKDDVITSADILTNRLFCFFANIFWTKDGKRYRLSREDLRIK
jgi:hypothetical protein